MQRRKIEREREEKVEKTVITEEAWIGQKMLADGFNPYFIVIVDRLKSENKNMKMSAIWWVLYH